MASLHRTFALLAGVALSAATAHAQTRWNVDTKLSLAWWQVSPHLNHLWSTTCPEEPSWRPGEGRSGGWAINKELRTVYSKGMKGDQNVEDTVNVPMYPRDTVGVICTEAVSGHVVIGDTTRWAVTGRLAVKTDRFVSGEDRRDAFARQAVLQSGRYPEATFELDSLVGVRRQADTLHGTAIGKFTAHGTTNPMTAEVKSWYEAGGRRVQAKFQVAVTELTQKYGFSKYALGLGVGTRIWKRIFLGIDVLLRPGAASAGDAR
jgi:hypothetical protein